MASGANIRPLGKQHDNRRSQLLGQPRIEYHHDLKPPNHNNHKQEFLNQSHQDPLAVSHQNASAVLQRNYTCNIQRDTLHFEHVFATVHMDELPFY